jgi:hypothetical protein
VRYAQQMTELHSVVRQLVQYGQDGNRSIKQLDRVLGVLDRMVSPGKRQARGDCSWLLRGKERP